MTLKCFQTNAHTTKAQRKLDTHAEKGLRGEKPTLTKARRNKGQYE